MIFLDILIGDDIVIAIDCLWLVIFNLTKMGEIKMKKFMYAFILISLVTTGAATAGFIIVTKYEGNSYRVDCLKEIGCYDSTPTYAKKDGIDHSISQECLKDISRIEKCLSK